MARSWGASFRRCNRSGAASRAAPRRPRPQPRRVPSAAGPPRRCESWSTASCGAGRWSSTSTTSSGATPTASTSSRCSCRPTRRGRSGSSATAARTRERARRSPRSTPRSTPAPATCAGWRSGPCLPRRASTWRASSWPTSASGAEAAPRRSPPRRRGTPSSSWSSSVSSASGRAPRPRPVCARGRPRRSRTCSAPASSRLPSQRVGCWRFSRSRGARFRGGCCGAPPSNPGQSLRCRTPTWCARAASARRTRPRPTTTACVSSRSPSCRTRSSGVRTPRSRTRCGAPWQPGTPARRTWRRWPTIRCGRATRRQRFASLSGRRATRARSSRAATRPATSRRRYRSCRPARRIGGRWRSRRRRPSARPGATAARSRC